MKRRDRIVRPAEGDAEAWQVLADALLERGDPRGELLALGLSREGGRRVEIEERIAVLVAERRRGGGRFHERDTELEDHVAKGRLEIEWRNGLAERARVVEPWERGEPQAAEVLGCLLEAPSAELLRELAVDREHRDDVGLGVLGYRGIFEWAEPVLAKAELPALEVLRVGHEPDEEMHLSATSNTMFTSAAPGTPGARISRPDRYVGNVAAALAKMPNLRELHLTGEGIRVAKLPARLRTLRIETRFLRASSVRAIARAELPDLERMEIWLGHWPDSVTGFDGPEANEYYGPKTRAKDLQPILDGDGLPKLRHLALSNCAFMADVVEAVAASAIAPRLATLDLSYGFLSGGGQVAPLLEAAERLRGVKRIDLRWNQIFEKRSRARLREAFGDRVLLDPQDKLEGNAAYRLLAF